MHSDSALSDTHSPLFLAQAHNRISCNYSPVDFVPVFLESTQFAFYIVESLHIYRSFHASPESYSYHSYILEQPIKMKSIFALILTHSSNQMTLVHLSIRTKTII